MFYYIFVKRFLHICNLSHFFYVCLYTLIRINGLFWRGECVLEIKGFCFTYFVNMQCNINWNMFLFRRHYKKQQLLILCASQWSGHVSRAVSMVITAFVMLWSVYDGKTCLCLFLHYRPDEILFIICLNGFIPLKVFCAI